MAGPVTFTPPLVGTLAPVPPLPTGVFLYDGDRTFVPIPSLRWLRIDFGRGPRPPVCTLRYAYDVTDPAPVYFEDLLAVNRGGFAGASPYALQVDDRIVVVGPSPDGGNQFLFDGFIQIPEANVSGRNYDLALQAVGVAIRCWDEPLKGRRQRPAWAPQNNLNDALVDLPARCNPDGKANATGNPAEDGSWDRVWPKPQNGTSQYIADEDFLLGREFPEQKYPVFFDERYPPNLMELHDPPGGKPYVRRWTLEMAVRYLLAEGNGDMRFVENPDFATLPDLLAAAVPKDGDVVDPDDPSTYTREPIAIRDVLLSGKPWPEVLWHLLAPHGFAYAFRLVTRDGKPRTYLEIYRERDNLGATYRDLMLQEAGATLDPAQSNVSQFRLARDASQVVNSYGIDAREDEWEVGLVLAPLFPIESGDATATESFKSTNSDPNANRDKYRLYGLDEAGEGHWSFVTNAWLTGGFFDFAQLFADQNVLGQLGDQKWVVRRRVPRSALFSRDAAGNPRKVTLCLLTGYTGTYSFVPGLWDGTGIVQPIKGSWRLLDDRIGVRVTCADVTKFDIGDLPAGTSFAPPALKKDKLDLVQAIAADTAPANRVHFLLTCVVDADGAFDAEVARRLSSPTRHTVRRRVDARNRYRRQRIDRSSFWSRSTFFAADADDPNAMTVRDDEGHAQHYAKQLRMATDIPSFGGSVTIPKLTLAYKVGDRIRSIYPRLYLQTNVATEMGERPRYPIVVGLTLVNDPHPAVQLHLDDRRGDGEPDPGEA